MAQSQVSTPKISIVVPVYNVEKYLDTCVTSVLEQTFQDFEIILVDDGSPDCSGEMCDDWAKKDARIRVIHKENGGLSDARNAGINAAQGEYIGLVDSDDYIAPDMYEMLYNNITKEQADVAVCTIYSCYKDVVHPYGDGSYRVMSGMEMLGLSLEGEKVVISACPKLYRKEVLINTPFSVGKLYEDALILGELFSKVEKVVVEFLPKYYYVHHEGTITTTTYKSAKKDYIRAYEKNLKIVQDHCPQYLPAAYYRLFRAHYELLDAMILSNSEDAKADKPEAKRFIKHNFMKIMSSKYIVPTRKFAILVLLLSEKMYKYILSKKHTNTLS